jgi:hypothetical protein
VVRCTMERKGADGGKHRFPPKKKSGRWDGHSKGKNLGGWVDQVVVDNDPALLPLLGGIQKPYRSSSNGSASLWYP